MEDYFLHILKGRATGKERSEFFRDLEESPERKREYMALEKLWVAHNMAFHKTSAKTRKQSFEKFWQAVHQPRHHSALWSIVSGAAAVLIIALLAGRILFPDLTLTSPETLTLSSPKGNISEVELNDGSRIWLNSGTEVNIDIYGNRKTLVDLDGEAYFDVPHIAERDFIVRTGDYHIHDLGTEFNVKYEKDAANIRVALFEGDISFKEGEREVVSELSPGEVFDFETKTGAISIQEADKEFITAWKEGKFVFVDKSLGAIARELEEWYDVRFVFKNEAIKDEVFTGVIKRRTSMEHLLKVLELSSEMDYIVEDRDDGSCVVIFE
ncbi:MAG: FecR family protein [Marinilabiliaceae bacterium]